MITSDHGNMIGETVLFYSKKMYGHQKGMHCETLCKVPWLIINNSGRKEVIGGDPLDKKTDMNEEVADRLNDLGYKDV